VLCVDDNPDVAEVLAAAVDAEDDMRSVGVLASADALCDEIESRRPDVVLVDLTMPGRPPVEAIEEAAARFPTARAVVVSGYDDPATVDEAVTRGAWGFVSKSSGVDRMLDAVRAVARGEAFLDRA
jgi:DNA-binding NarL/FixJ family response regulator